MCIADDSKRVERLGSFPLPVEVLPMSRSLVARNLIELGGRPIWREALETDNGNWILDVHDLFIEDPQEIGSVLNVMWVLRALERVGDHATNIAEHVIYLVKGTDIRHLSVTNVEETLKTTANLVN